MLSGTCAEDKFKGELCAQAWSYAASTAAYCHTEGCNLILGALPIQKSEQTEAVNACRYAELNGDNRSFTEEEESLFDRSAEFAYESFRDKAAESRHMPKEELQQHAQGRSDLYMPLHPDAFTQHVSGRPSLTCCWP